MIKHRYGITLPVLPWCQHTLTHLYVCVDTFFYHRGLSNRSKPTSGFLHTRHIYNLIWRVFARTTQSTDRGLSSLSNMLLAHTSVSLVKTSPGPSIKKIKNEPGPAPVFNVMLKPSLSPRLIKYVLACFLSILWFKVDYFVDLMITVIYCHSLIFHLIKDFALLKLRRKVTHGHVFLLCKMLYTYVKLFQL